MPEALNPQLGMEAVVVLAAALAAVIVVNLIPSLSDPFDLLFILVHEMGHVLASLFTGGEVKNVILYPSNGTYGGVTLLNPQKPGNLALVASAGYLGTPLFSALLILLTGWPYVARYSLIILGFLVMWAVLRFSDRSSCLTMFTGLGFGILFIGVALAAELVWTVFLLYFLALQGIWTSLKHLLVVTMLVSGNPPSQGDDATKMALFVGCTTGFWVITWLLFSIAALGAAFWFVWLRPLAS